jgi:hypothetical protein
MGLSKLIAAQYSTCYSPVTFITSGTVYRRLLALCLDKSERRTSANEPAFRLPFLIAHSY